MNFRVLQGAYSINVCDLDGDGKSDISYGNAGASENMLFPPGVSVLPNTSRAGAISFGTRIDYGVGGTNYDLTSGDINGDGKPELVLADYVTGYFAVLKNNSTPGSISMQLAGKFRSNSNPLAVNIADIDGDGKPDILTLHISGSSDRTICVYRNTGTNGDISFAPKVEFIFSNGQQIYAKDIDGDGKPEMVYVSDNSLSVYKNTSTPGNISFAPKLSLGVNAAVLAIGDADGDGKTDIAVNSGNGISMYRNTGTTGTISFADPVGISSGALGKQMFFSDIDGDGKPDLVGFSEDPANKANVLKNRSSIGSMSFAAMVSYSVGGRAYYVAGGDIDGDSKPDILTYNMTDSISILRNKIAEPATVSSGANPVVGDISTTVKVDETVQTYLGSPYVQRHYDIEPDINPATSTATLTLYFTQEDFNSFNASAGHGLSLPANANDNAGKANLRVFQHHGTSETGVPGSYTGTAVEINPDDNKIIWNDLLKRWEVTFDVTGFSGFFISSSSNVVLPLSLLSFEGKVQNASAVLQWTTTNEVNAGYFELQRSTTGVDFITVSKIASASVGTAKNVYQFTDKVVSGNSMYYRLKMVDKDGSFKYSDVVKLNTVNRSNGFSVYPNPAHGSATVEILPSTTPSKLQLLDISGQAVKVYVIAGGTSTYKMNLAGIKPGTYKLVWTDGKISKPQTLIVE